MNRIVSRLAFSSRRAVIVSGVVAVAGIGLIYHSFGATQGVSFEAESGILRSSATRVSDSLASATQAVQFGPTITSNIFFGLASPGSDLGTAVTAAGRNPAVYMDYRDWAHNPDYTGDIANTAASYGAKAMITWEPWDYSAGLNQPSYTLSSIYSGNYDSYINRWATEIKTDNRPIYLRFAHEMNGNYYPWAEGVNTNRPGDYVKAWNHIHFIFNQVGVSNVTWVWSPNISYPGTTAMSELYPGDGSVDIAALDGYNFGTTNNGSWQSFEQVFGPSIAQVRLLTTKPLIIGETGSSESGGDKAHWIGDMYSRLRADNLKGFIWFNFDKETDWRIQSSPSSQAAFQNGIHQPSITGGS